MRVRDIIVEDRYDDIIEDEADARGDANLITALEFLRNRAHDKHYVPRVRVDSLINMVREIPGTEQFDLGALENAKKTNDSVKELIKDIKDDEKTGAKYVYLAPFEDDTDESVPPSESPTASAPEKTVGSMAKAALKARG